MALLGIKRVFLSFLGRRSNCSLFQPQSNEQRFRNRDFLTDQTS